MTTAKKSSLLQCGQNKHLIRVLLTLFVIFLTVNVVIFDVRVNITSIRFRFPFRRAKNYSQYPALVWYTKGYIEIQPTLTCYKGNRCNYSKAFNCNIYHQEEEPDNTEAYLFYGYEIDKFPLPRDPKTIWGLYYDESPKLKPMLMHEKGLNLFNYSMTFSRYSDVPFLFSFLLYPDATFTRYFVKTSVKKHIYRNYAPVMFYQGNCASLTERESYVKELQKYISIDSYGTCLHNKDLPPTVSQSKDMINGDAFKMYLGRYRFQLTIENAICVDYVTEKLWRALEVGVVPIYYGSPSIRDWLPNNKSAILLEDFPTPELLSQHLHYLMSNDTAYEEYLEHKILGRVTNQRLKDAMKQKFKDDECEGKIEDAFLCLICEKVHDKNSTKVTMVTKKHFDCPIPPKSALTLSVNPNNTWLNAIDKCKVKVDELYQEIYDTDMTPRDSRTSWYSW